MSLSGPNTSHSKELPVCRGNKEGLSLFLKLSTGVIRCWRGTGLENYQIQAPLYTGVEREVKTCIRQWEPQWKPRVPDSLHHILVVTQWGPVTPSQPHQTLSKQQRESLTTSQWPPHQPVVSPTVPCWLQGLLHRLLPHSELGRGKKPGEGIHNPKQEAPSAFHDLPRATSSMILPKSNWRSGEGEWL